MSLLPEGEKPPPEWDEDRPTAGAPHAFQPPPARKAGEDDEAHPAPAQPPTWDHLQQLVPADLGPRDHRDAPANLTSGPKGAAAPFPQYDRSRTAVRPRRTSPPTSTRHTTTWQEVGGGTDPAFEGSLSATPSVGSPNRSRSPPPFPPRLHDVTATQSMHRRRRPAASPIAYGTQPERAESVPPPTTLDEPEKTRKAAQASFLPPPLSSASP